jgi:hypothetical protein
MNAARAKEEGAPHGGICDQRWITCRSAGQSALIKRLQQLLDGVLCQTCRMKHTV